MSNGTDGSVVMDGEVDEHGCAIYRGEQADARIGVARGDTRYPYDEALCATGWRQYDTDQDAYYFGKWVHMQERKVFCYAEGDRALVTCPTQQAFAAQLRSMAAFYGDPPPAYIVIDPARQVTAYYDPRPAV